VNGFRVGKAHAKRGACTRQHQIASASSGRCPVEFDHQFASVDWAFPRRISGRLNTRIRADPNRTAVVASAVVPGVIAAYKHNPVRRAVNGLGACEESDEQMTDVAAAAARARAPGNVVGSNSSLSSSSGGSIMRTSSHHGPRILDRNPKPVRLRRCSLQSDHLDALQPGRKQRTGQSRDRRCPQGRSRLARHAYMGSSHLRWGHESRGWLSRSWHVLAFGFSAFPRSAVRSQGCVMGPVVWFGGVVATR